MTKPRRASARRPARASILYSDDLVDPKLGALFLTGELPICDTSSQLRELVLTWRGVQAELRPREARALGPHLDQVLEHLTAAWSAFDAVSEAAEELSEERRERSRREDETC